MSDEQERKPSIDEQLEAYRIPGTNAINWSRYARENLPHDPPRFEIGDVVAYLVIGEITRVYEDCDGEVLYTVNDYHSGITDGSLRLATDDEKADL
jgi:hypothetical protein